MSIAIHKPLVKTGNRERDKPFIFTRRELKCKADPQTFQYFRKHQATLLYYLQFVVLEPNSLQEAISLAPIGNQCPSNRIPLWISVIIHQSLGKFFKSHAMGWRKRTFLEIDTESMGVNPIYWSSDTWIWLLLWLTISSILGAAFLRQLPCLFDKCRESAMPRDSLFWTLRTETEGVSIQMSGLGVTLL